jgi:signal transduction histidine kinase
MSKAHTVLLNAILLLVYFAAGKFGLSHFAVVHPSASPVWLPTGVAMAALLLFGFRLAPAVFVGAFLVNSTTAGSILSSLGVAAGNTLEAVVGVWLVERFAHGRDAFSSAAGFLRFAGLAAGLSTTLSATIGVASLTLTGYAPVAVWGDIWLTWWFGNVAGAVLVTPLIVLWWTEPALNRSRQQWRELALLLLSTAAIGALTFAHPVLVRYPLMFLCLVPLVGGALRFGPREVSAAVALLAVIATAATAAGRGTAIMLPTNESLLVLQAFLVVVALTAMPMSALTIERRKLLERERAARNEAVAAAGAKDEFIAVVSHELRNPLAAITTAVAALDSGAVAPRAGGELIAVIRRQSRQLARLIDDLLDVGRATARKLIVQTEPLELAGVVGQTVEATLAARGLPPERIGLALEPVWIDGDPVRMVQIVENLVDNALKHTPAGKRITVTVKAQGGEAELRVEDEGHGIDPELLPNVFEPFIQGAQGLDRNAGGLGLGLTLIRRLTELHGGVIEAASGGTNRGSSFVVRLPRRVAPAAAPTVAAELRSMPASLLRVLIVEDNADTRQSLRILFESLGHAVRDVADGEAGLAAIRVWRPDVVLVDIGLPWLDGYEVARRIREADRGIRLVALTGYGCDADVQRARAAGFDEHVLKPASAERLRMAIEGG